MEWACNNFLIWLALLIFTALILLNHIPLRLAGRKQPPGPPGWPFFGNIFDLGAMPHQNFHKLKAKYGPVIWLRLGFTNTLVIQSAMAAEELFKNHDLVFSDRKVPEAFTANNYNDGSLSLGRYGHKWRMLRRLWLSELLSYKRIGESTPLRRKCIDKMIKQIEEDSNAAILKGESGEVIIGHYLFIMTFNFSGNLVLSQDILNSQSEDGSEFFDAMNNILEWGGKPNVADFSPFLKWFDPQRIKKKMGRHLQRAMKVLEGFVKERVEEHKLASNNARKDFLDILLEHEGDEKEDPNKISTQNILINILEVFLGGSGSSSITIEWALAELIRHPKSMRKLKEELNHVVGSSKKVEENNIEKLPYLQAVIKETLRLHPAGPLLLPRNTLKDTNFMGYYIPKDTQVFVNVWAIGRDPNSWEDPLAFKPERFLGSDIDFNGQNYKLIPFGSGRRICVGILLAYRFVHFCLASLVHCFEWELGRNYSPENIDMNERLGIIVRKLVPLKAIPKKKIMLE